MKIKCPFIYLVISLTVIIALSACSEPPSSSTDGIKAHWSIDSVSVDPALTYVTLEVTNELGKELTKDNWFLAYNHLIGQVTYKSEPTGMIMKHIGGDYIEVRPESTFEALADGKKRAYGFTIGGHLDKKSELPVGVFAVKDGQPIDIIFTSSGMNEDVLAPLQPTTALTRFVDNQRLSLLPREELLPFIPSPTSYTYLNEVKVLGRIVSFAASEGLDKEISMLTSGLEALGITGKKVDDDADITVAINMIDEEANDAYDMRIDNNGVAIIGSTSSGIFYGIQSLLQYIAYAQQETTSDQISLRGIEVADQARFDYRGMHLDVSRNFHRISSVKKLVDQMAAMKLNHLQMHVTDDEGWRLEIPGLPELTEVGSQRGYTQDESDKIMPSYGSGPYAHDSYGSGYYSREEYIDLLKYADARHIKIITEIDLPAHARAAIIAMKARYKKLADKGDTAAASRYRLDDPDDVSVYRSAQNWTDNVICVCQESAYVFAEKVIDELVAMYREADVPIDAIHIGGDELPYGAWQKSPLCEAYIANQKEITNSDDLPAYFFKRIKEITDKHGIITAGWEDIVLLHSKDAHDGTDINMAFQSASMRPYVWNAIMGGGREDMIYRLANAGFDVVMSNSSSFYFDMAYDRDPDEIGLSWSGFADTEKSFATEPLNIFHGSPTDSYGNLLEESYVSQREQLNENGRKHFLGIQAQLWSETVRDAESIEYLTYPKILGFAERAWASAGPWIDEYDPDRIKEVYEKEWNLLANTIGQKALHMYDAIGDGLKYRIPEPGITYVNDRLHANTTYPGLKIFYQTGLDEKIHEYDGPIEVTQGLEIKLWSESSTGRKGRMATPTNN